MTISHDNDGREIGFEDPNIERFTLSYDAAGKQRFATESNNLNQYPDPPWWVQRLSASLQYDGDGQKIGQQDFGADWPNYYIRSTPLGGAVVAELRTINSNWAKDVFVYAGGEIVAQQKDNQTPEVKWLYTNPITGAKRGAVQTEPDPLGTDQGLSQRQPNPPIYSGDSGIMDPGRYADAFNGRMGCTINGAPSFCVFGPSLLTSGAADIDWENSDPWHLAEMGIFRSAVYRYRDRSRNLPDRGETIRVETRLQRIFAGWQYHFLDPGPRPRGPWVQEDDPPVSPPAAEPPPLDTRCDRIARQLLDHLGFFEELWQATGSGTPNRREQGGLIGVSMSNITAGRGREDSVIERFTGRTYETTMGEEYRNGLSVA